MSEFGLFLTLVCAFGAMIGLITFNVFVRGPKVMRSNAAIVEGQQRLVALNTRQAEALERIAAALETRG